MYQFCYWHSNFSVGPFCFKRNLVPSPPSFLPRSPWQSFIFILVFWICLIFLKQEIFIICKVDKLHLNRFRSLLVPPTLPSCLHSHGFTDSGYIFQRWDARDLKHSLKTYIMKKQNVLRFFASNFLIPFLNSLIYCMSSKCTSFGEHGIEQTSINRNIDLGSVWMFHWAHYFWGHPDSSMGPYFPLSPERMQHLLLTTPLHLLDTGWLPWMVTW